MTEKELKKMNRYQLLELLVLQTERMEKLQRKVNTLEEALNRRNLEMTALGSIAEASLQLSGIFEAAQEAADRYLEEAKKRAAEIEENARRKAESILEEAEFRVNGIWGD